MKLDPVRYSHLKNIARSPAYYRAMLTSNKFTAPMRLGRVVDAYLTGGKKPVVFDGTRRGKVWEEFQAEHAGEEIITASEEGTAVSMVQAVLHNPEAVRLLTGKRQQEIAWQYLGRDVVSHPDVLGEEGGYGFVTDLKTCSTSQPVRFTGQALRFAYHVQVASYIDGATAAGLGEFRNGYLVAVESSAPYQVTVMKLTERALEAGRRLWRTWFETLLACEAADHWPSYCESIVDLDVPEDLELVYGDDESEAA